MKSKATGISRGFLVLMALVFSNCYSALQPADGHTDTPGELEARGPDTEEPPGVTCDGPVLSVEELNERFDELLSTPVCIEGRLDAVGCTCVEDWPCTPPYCGYVCTGNAGFRAGDITYYFVETGWECECSESGSCVSCTPLPCGEPIRIIAVPQIYLDVLRRLEIEEICYPPLPEP